MAGEFKSPSGMSNYVERVRKRKAINEYNKRKHIQKKIAITLDENKQVTWFMDYVVYETEKRKYSSDYVQKLRRMPYKSYLRTPHWQRVKRAAYGKLGRVCHACGYANKEIHVHHLSYKNRGREDMEDLMLLCKDCHEMVHEKMKQTEENNKKYIDPKKD